MSEGRLINVFCWKPTPGLQWRCHEGVSGITVDADSQEAAIAEFNNIWNFRTPLQWIYEAPKRPRRPDEPKPVSAGHRGRDGCGEVSSCAAAALASRFTQRQAEI